jgi:hypothetical protein
VPSLKTGLLFINEKLSTHIVNFNSWVFGFIECEHIISNGLISYKFVDNVRECTSATVVDYKPGDLLFGFIDAKFNFRERFTFL